MHYYAKVQLPQISWRPRSDPQICVIRSGLYAVLREVNITAPLSRREIERDPKRYRGWKAGEPYPGFLTAQSAYDAAIGWVAKMTRGLDVVIEDDGYEVRRKG